MSATTNVRRIGSPLHYRLQRWGVEAVCLLIGAVLLVWTLAPIYNMFQIALDSHDDIFSGNLWPEHPSLDAFRVVVTQDFWYLAHFWHRWPASRSGACACARVGC